MEIYFNIYYKQLNLLFKQVLVVKGNIKKFKIYLSKKLQ